MTNDTAFVPDGTTPVISSVSHSGVTSSAATVAWTTNEASDTLVEYGTTTSYGSTTALNASMVTSHSANLTGLAAGTTYYYRVNSRGAAGNLARAAGGPFTTTTASNQVPVTVSASPATGSGSIQTFAAVYSDGNGYADMQTVELLVNATTATSNVCFARYNRVNNTVEISNDAGTSWLGGVVIGTANALQENTRCALHVGSSSASPSGNSLTVNFALTLKPVFSGAKNVYLRAYDAVSNSGLVDRGDYTVAANAAPTTAAVGGSGATSSTQTFTFNFGDTNGFVDLSTVKGLINTSTSEANACSWTYTRSNNTLQLKANDGAAIAGSLNPGSGGTVQNSQCRLSAASTTGSGTALGLAVTVEALGTFSGSKTLYESSADTAGSTTGWVGQGTWNAGVPTTITTSPAGLSLTVDGGACTSPCTFQWASGTNHTVALNSPQSSYWFSYWSDGGPQSHTISAPSTASTFTAAMATSAVQALRDCIGASINSACTLPAGVHPVSATIPIGRSNVVVSGGTSNRSDTKLVRAAAFTGELISADAASPLTGITIQNLTVCGGSTLTGGASPAGCDRNPISGNVCDRMTNELTQHPDSTVPIDTTLPNPLFICSDLRVFNAATLTGAAPSPWTYTGPYSVTFNNVGFEDASGHAISLYGNVTVGKKVNDIYITGSAINRSAVTGILSGADGVDYDRKFCDSAVGFKDDLSLYSPRNIRIEGSSFTGHLTGAIGMNQARWVGLRNNTFSDNYNNPQVGNIEGGTVFFDQCTDTIDIAGNTMTGPINNYGQTQGLELWGKNITVQNNPNISGYGNEGIQLNSVLNATVTNNNVHHNNENLTTTGYAIGGIQVWTSPPWGVCEQIPRNSQFISITGNSSSNQAYGIGFGDRGQRSRNIITGLYVYNNTLSPSAITEIRQYNGHVSVGGQVTPLPSGIESAYSPRALPVDAVAPAQSLCRLPGASRQTFRFSGSDVNGVATGSLQGYFSTTGTEMSGPSGAGCHFLYDYASNTIYLNSQTPDNIVPPDYPWSGGSSYVGYGGSSLSNGYCKIHAGSSSTISSSEGGTYITGQPGGIPNIRNLTLDVEFINTVGNKRIYVAVQNAEGSLSREDFYDANGQLIGSTNWPYLGWWAAQ